MADRFVTNYKVMDLARKYIGTVERPVNRTIFGEWFGWNGVAWCAIFQSFIHWFGGAKFPAIQKDKGTASVVSCVEHAKRTGQWHARNSGYHPKAGDLVVFWFTSRPDHIALIEMIYGLHDLGTIEGNTNAAGSRTGGMVARLRRRTGIHGYIQVDNQAQGGVDLIALRRYLAALSFNEVSKIRTRVPTDNAYGDDIKAIQKALNTVQNANLVVDGDYGPATFLNVAGYQNNCKKFGLPVTDQVGIFGDSTKWWLCTSLGNIRDGKAP